MFFLAYRQGKDYPCPIADAFRLGPDAASVLIHDLPGDGKPHSRPAHHTGKGAVNLVEPFKYLLKVILPKAYAFVLAGNAQKTLIFLDVELYRPSPGGKLDRVSKYIAYYPLEPYPVCKDLPLTLVFLTNSSTFLFERGL